ncbi:MAG: hypothetical protein ACR2MY_14690 [Candidatus Dormibacteria bacterium]
MSRSQVSLPSEELKRAKDKAAALDISLAEYIRRLVAQDLARPRPTVDRSMLMNLGDSGGSNIRHHKDDYVGSAVEKDLQGGRAGRP